MDEAVHQDKPWIRSPRRKTAHYIKLTTELDLITQVVHDAYGTVLIVKKTGPSRHLWHSAELPLPYNLGIIDNPVFAVYPGGNWDNKTFQKNIVCTSLCGRWLFVSSQNFEECAFSTSSLVYYQLYVLYREDSHTVRILDTRTGANSLRDWNTVQKENQYRNE